ncbi:hypothetical protein ABEB36_004431 [Hypothenemus hampei]|uniref:Uncharacterized protein n=1 Tax=Hypothenemus hampei TaxID=57062 RepID=A0ABD1F3D5_HYPHA
MAFMMPVVKNDWDIYKSNRSRKNSECNTSCTTRTRKISECRSEGQASPKLIVPPLAKHHSVPDRMPSRVLSRPKINSENLPAKNRVPEKTSNSSSSNDLNKKNCNGTSWLDKLKKLVKTSKKDEERTQS